MATVAVRGLNLTPDPPTAEDPTPRPDLVWTFGQPPGLTGVWLFRGREPAYPVSEGRPVTVRGFDGRIGSIHEGFGLEWTEGSDPCERYTINAFSMTEAEMLRFANGLRRQDK
jgi:hypothetical protein